MKDQSKTKRARSESESRKSEKSGWTILENIQEGYYEVDLAGNYTFFNSSMSKILGYTKEEMMGMNYRLYMDKENTKKIFRDFNEVYRTGISLKVDYEQIKKDGSKMYVETSVALMRDSFGKPTGFQGIVRDITDRKRAEEALRESEELLNSYLENAPDGIYMNNLEGNFLYGNRRCEEITGYRREELIGKNFLELNLLSENSLNKAVRLLQVNMEGKSTGPDEIEIISKNGRIIPIEINTNVVQRIAHRVIIASVRDITERKRAEDVLRESEGRFDQLAEQSGTIAWEVDAQGLYTYVSHVSEAVLGYCPDELVGRMHFYDMHPESGREEFKKAAFAVFDRKEPFRNLENAVQTKDGHHVWLSTNGIALLNTDETLRGYRGSDTDITARKQTEEELQRTLESLRKAVGATIQVMASAVEARDPYTSGHQIRSANLARTIATEMGLSHEKIEGIRVAGSIHDIGKLSIPAEILSKPGKLSEIEFSLIKEHTRKGFEMLKDVESPWPLAEIIYQHHERIDGSGYPRNLKKDDILMEARILAVADVVEAMASHRPYRPGSGIDAALNEIEKNRGIFYDNTVADACLRLFREKGFQLAGT